MASVTNQQSTGIANFCGSDFPQWKTLGCAIAIIVSLAAVAVGLAGLGAHQGWWHAGALNELGQMRSIILITAGAGGAIVFLSLNILVYVREPAPTVDTQEGLIYGPEFWDIWKAEILDTVPKAPEIDWDEIDPVFQESYRENYILLYVPSKMKINGEETRLSLNVLEKLTRFNTFDYASKQKFGDTRIAHPRWVLISKRLISRSYEQSSQVIASTEKFRTPYAVEAVLLNLLVHAFTGEKLYGEGIFTRCQEFLKGNGGEYIIPLAVGGFGNWGISIIAETRRNDGLAVVKTF